VAFALLEKWSVKLTAGLRFWAN